MAYNLPLDAENNSIGMHVYYKDSGDKLCQYFVTSEIMNLKLAIQDCRAKVIADVTDLKPHTAVLALIQGSKA